MSMRWAWVAVLCLVPPQETSSLWEDRGFGSDTSEIKDVYLHEGSRAATLKSDLTKLGYHSDPGKWDVIGNMVLLDGKLLASASFDFSTGRMLSPWAYSEASQVLEYDPVADDWSVIKDIDASMIFNLRVINGKLMVPEYYPWTADRVTTYDGKEWSILGKLPGPMLHGMDICTYKDKLYWSGSWRATTVEEALNDTNWYGGYGKVYESADDGKTWKEVYSDKLNGRMQDMVVLKNKIYCNRRGQVLMSYDGKEWKEIPVGLPGNKGEKPVLGSGLLYVHKDHILAVSSPLYYRFDGDKWTSYMPGFLRLSVDGDTLYGIRDDGHVYTSTDGKTWKKMTEVGVPKEEFDRQCEKGRTLRRASVALHRGKLLVGTGATGKIYESPFLAQGTLIGPYHKTEGGSTLSWEAAVPEGAKLTISVRTAKAAKDLKDEAWKGEFTTSPAKITVPKDHKYIQYRATLQSTDAGRHSPAVKSFSWSK